ncbi:MAG TPA: hypothetical protein VFY93_15480 [Planctomycetota bacterium]|nr:hypothetical protein [Planctomycetota bacterium]
MLDNGLTRWAAAKLEHDHNRMLGSRATMGIARSFNGWKNRRCVRFREEKYRSLDELIRENGAPKGPAIELKDGWAIDTSRTLPHLDRLLQESQEIIAERGGVVRGGGSREFFQQIITDAHIARYGSILDFATSSDVLLPAIRYLGFLPTLSAAKPLGVRLAESDQRFVEDWDGKYRASQLFHCDYHDSPMVYVIVCLRDVTRASGPFSFLPISASDRVREALRYRRRGVPYRMSDEEIFRHVDRKELIELAYPAGTVLFLDSSRCFHYGSRDCTVPRYLMMYAYVSVQRTDFTDLLRKESPVPLEDPATRDRRMRYPVKPGDSLLRRLILDRELA